MCCELHRYPSQQKSYTRARRDHAMHMITFRLRPVAKLDEPADENGKLARAERCPLTFHTG